MPTRRLLDPSNDYVFKILFKDPGDERRLIAMLTAVLEPSVPIASAKVLNPQIPADIADAKSIVLDILVELADGETVYIEMESWPRPVFVARNLYYWARSHGNQLGSGDDYRKLRPTIAIAWLANPRDRSRSIIGATKVHSRFRIRETSTGAELTDHLEMHVLDLRNLATDGTLSRELRMWALLFDHPTDEALRALAEQDEIMADTIQKLAHVSADDEAYQIAEARWRGEVKLSLDRAYERDEGLAEGLAKGEALGLAKGEAQGLAKGEAQGLARGVLAVLNARFGATPPAMRSRIEACDSAALSELLARALVVASPDALFGG